MMVANSSNLIITVKPVNQHNNVKMDRSSERGSKKSIASNASAGSAGSVSMATSAHATTNLISEDGEDTICDHLSSINVEQSSSLNNLQT